MASPKSTAIRIIGRKLANGPTAWTPTGWCSQPHWNTAVTRPRAAATDNGKARAAFTGTTPARLAASVHLGHTSHAQQSIGPRPKHQLLQTTGPLQVPCLRCREDTLPQTPYVVLDPLPVHLVPVENIVLRSVHHHSKAVLVPNLSFGSNLVGHRHASQAHLTRVSPLSGSGIRPVSGQLYGNDRRRTGHTVPFSCRLSATGIRFSGHPFPAEGLGHPHGRLTGRRAHDRTPTGFPRSTRSRSDREGCPCTPRAAVLTRAPAPLGDGPGRQKIPGRRLSLHSGQPLHPAQASHPAGLTITRHQTEVHSRSPVRSAPCP